MRPIHAKDAISKLAPSNQRPRRLNPLPLASLRIGIQRDVGDDSRAVSPGTQSLDAAFRRQAADGDQRQAPDFAPPQAKLIEPLRRPGICFSRVGKIGPSAT